MRGWQGCVVAAALLVHFHAAVAAPTQRSTLDRVAFAVDGAESSHGENVAMWRPNPSGPQGPMQVTAAAATDVGGGDRFDPADNRALGRAYLEALYRRYRNWPDAIAAYNWGIGRLNAWLAAGRPAGKLAPEVAAYTDRVLRDSGLCAATPASARGAVVTRRVAGRRRRVSGRTTSLDPGACAQFAAGPRSRAELAVAKWRRDNRLLVGLLPEGLYRQLEAAVDRTELDLRAAQQR